MARYIDVEKLKSDIIKTLGIKSEEFLTEQERVVYKEIDKQPTADVRENVCGKWVEDEFGVKCSRCGKYTHLDKFDRPMRFLFCSMCGAKMEV